MVKKQTKQIISGSDLVINSANKQGRHDSEVSTGCGAHKNVKKYSRRTKHKADYQHRVFNLKIG